MKSFIAFVFAAFFTSSSLAQDQTQKCSSDSPQPGQADLTSRSYAFLVEKIYPKVKHITPIENNASIVKYAAVCEKHGEIIVSYTIGQKTVESLVETSGFAFTPSMAYNKLTAKIGIVFARTRFGVFHSNMDTTDIIFSSAPYDHPFSFNTRQTIAMLIYPHDVNDPFYANPSIAATNNTVNEFWISYRDTTKGGALLLIDKDGKKVNTVYFNGGNPSSTKFIALGTHNESDNLHIAFEEHRNDNMQVYYTQAILQSTDSIILKPVESVSSYSKYK
jgi:hypothetical protein